MCQDKTGYSLVSNDVCTFACFENGKWEKVKGAPPNPDKNKNTKLEGQDYSLKQDSNPTEDATKDWCSCKIKLPTGKGTGFLDGSKKEKDFLRCENMCQDKIGQSLVSNDDCTFACFESGKWEKVKVVPLNPDKNKNTKLEGQDYSLKQDINPTEDAREEWKSVNGKWEKVKEVPLNPGKNRRNRIKLGYEG